MQSQAIDLEEKLFLGLLPFPQIVGQINPNCVLASASSL